MKKQTISAKIIAHSKNELGNEIITYLLTYPRFIHGELLTHRMFSRNSASSRAIPFKKTVEMVQEDPFIPIAFQKHHKGMQGNEYLQGEDLENAIDRWNDAKNYATVHAKDLYNTGTTKQLCNRLLEPFMWHTTLITATEWDNFFSLRCPKYVFHDYNGDNIEYSFKSKKDAINYFGGNEIVEYTNKNVPLKDLSHLQWLELNESQAEIHIQSLAEAMWDAKNESIPNQLKSGEFHIPFIEIEEDLEITK